MIFYIIFGTFGFSLLVTILVITLLNRKNWKHYKKVYQSLPSRYYYKSRDTVYSFNHNRNDGFRWIPKKKWICVKYSEETDRGIYLTAGVAFILDPYSFYWWKKYTKWLKQNIDMQGIREYY